jgi:hypothetical protein
MLSHFTRTSIQANDARKYTNGAVGSLLHAIVLHGVNYSIELQVYADGVSLDF